jgi:nitroreductase
MSINLLKERISVRKYETRPVEREKLEAMIDAARFAPTGRNEQPWELVVVTDESKRAELAAITEYGKFIAAAPACIAVFCKDTKYYLEDGSAVTTYILLAATALGLGSCWVAGDKKPYTETIRELLKAPPGNRLIALIAIGYPAEHQPKPKRAMTEIVHWENF